MKQLCTAGDRVPPGRGFGLSDFHRVARGAAFHRFYQKTPVTL
jgi:hypothetical protein